MAQEARFENSNYGAEVGFNSGTVNNYFGPQNGSTSPFNANPNVSLGLNLGAAPQIDESLFVARKSELAQLTEWLSPSSNKQNIVALSGLGGVGKTQLSIRFARMSHESYSSIFWLDAKDEDTLKTEYVALASRIQLENDRGVVNNQLEEAQAVTFVRQWFSQTENTDWLLIYDNYDNPKFSKANNDHEDGYDIRALFPYRVQGSILITTRSTQLTFAKQLPLTPLKELDDGLEILAVRSGRDVFNEPGAKKLAQRLDGLPLALATAGSYLRKTSATFETYLRMYDESRKDLEQAAFDLPEYADRTLWSTWNMSLKQVQKRDKHAATLMKFLAYFGNTDLWYDLFKSGATTWPWEIPKSSQRFPAERGWYERFNDIWSNFTAPTSKLRGNLDHIPSWFLNLVSSEVRFQSAMAALHEYSLVEVRSDGYSLHKCVHDWALSWLNPASDPALCRLAAHCVARCFRYDKENDFWLTNSRLLDHLGWLEHLRFENLLRWEDMDSRDLVYLSFLARSKGRENKSLELCHLAVEIWAKNLNIFGRSGDREAPTGGARYALVIAFLDKIRLFEAANLLRNALKTLSTYLNIFNGGGHISHPQNLTLGATYALGFVFLDRGRNLEAAKLLRDALETLSTNREFNVIPIAMVYSGLGESEMADNNLDSALEMYNFALQQLQSISTPESVLEFQIQIKIGGIHFLAGDVEKAESIFEEAWKKFKNGSVREEANTFDLVEFLAQFYEGQDQLALAIDMFHYVVLGREKINGFNAEVTELARKDLSRVKEKHEKEAQASKLNDS